MGSIPRPDIALPVGTTLFAILVVFVLTDDGAAGFLSALSARPGIRTILWPVAALAVVAFAFNTRQSLQAQVEDGSRPELAPAVNHLPMVLVQAAALFGVVAQYSLGAHAATLLAAVALAWWAKRTFPRWTGDQS